MKPDNTSVLIKNATRVDECVTIWSDVGVQKCFCIWNFPSNQGNEFISKICYEGLTDNAALRWSNRYGSHCPSSLEVLWWCFWHWDSVISVSPRDPTVQCNLSQLDNWDAVLSGTPFYLISTNKWAQKGYFWFRLIAGDVPMIIVLITYYRIKKTLSLQGSLMSELMKHTISQSTMIFKAMEPKSQNTKVEPSPKQIQNQQKKRDLF